MKTEMTDFGDYAQMKTLGFFTSTPQQLTFTDFFSCVCFDNCEENYEEVSLEHWQINRSNLED